MILLSDDMFDYIVRLLGWAVDGGTKVSQHPVLRYNFLFVSEEIWRDLLLLGIVLVMIVQQ